jgi:hypothetical protein
LSAKPTNNLLRFNPSKHLVALVVESMEPNWWYNNDFRL